MFNKRFIMLCGVNTVFIGYGMFKLKNILYY